MLEGVQKYLSRSLGAYGSFIKKKKTEVWVDLWTKSVEVWYVHSANVYVYHFFFPGRKRKG
jgi:hypothetical protein